jgi:filamentous hemagglutinin family protein
VGLYRLILPLLAFPASAGWAQIAADGSLGTVVNRSGNAWTISGGTQRGGNLFQSFMSFSVPGGASATFTGPGSVREVVARVTGPGASNIDGALRSTIPGASLWLVNPHGVSFGSGASVDVQGSLHVGSAHYIALGDGRQFGAATPASMLTSAPPASFGFLGATAPLGVAGSLAVRDGATLALAGTDVSLAGASLTAGGGRLEIVASGTLDARDSLMSTSSPAMPASGGVFISAGRFTAVNTTVRAENHGVADAAGLDFRIAGVMRMTDGGVLSHALGAGRSADIRVEAGELQLLSGAQLVSTASSGSGGGGSIEVVAGGSVLVQGEGTPPFTSGIHTTSLAASTGKAGSISIRAGSLSVLDGAAVSASTFGAGPGGNVSIAVAGPLVLRGETASAAYQTNIEASTYGLTGGDAGSIAIAAGSIEILGGARIRAETYGSGLGGSVSVSAAETLHIDGTGSAARWSGILVGSLDNATAPAGSVSVRAGALNMGRKGMISANSYTAGRAGNVNVTAGRVFMGGDSEISSDSEGSGAAGNVSVSGESIDLHGAFSNISSALFGAGERAGDVRVSASGLLRVHGFISAETLEGARGDGGNVSISARDIRLVGGGLITTVNRGPGAGGNIDATAVRSLWAAGEDAHGFTSGIAADAEASGPAGSIRLRAGRIFLGDGATIQSGTFGRGDAGSIDVHARGTVHISGTDREFFPSGILASANTSTGDAGAISVRARAVLLDDGGKISSSTFTSGRGGDVRVRARENVIVSGTSLDLYSSGILATAADGTGDAGSVRVRAPSIIITGGGEVSSETYSSGNGGDVRVIAPASLVVSGVTPDGYSSLIGASSVGRDGAAGSIFVRAGSVQLLGGATIGSSTYGAGAGGNIRVLTAGVLRVAGESAGGNESGIYANSETGATGRAGSVVLRAGALEVLDGAVVTSSTWGRGAGGDVRVLADRVTVAGRGPSGYSAGIYVTAESARPDAGEGGSIRIRAADAVILRDGAALTGQSLAADGGDIVIRAGRLLYLRNASITTSVGTGAGSGGNISIDPQFVVLDHSQIIANAFGGNGGNISIIADNFLSQDSVVQASSQLGISGTVAISAPRIDVSSSLGGLNATYLDASRLIRESCASRSARGASSFLAVGRGGLAENCGGR